MFLLQWSLHTWEGLPGLGAKQQDEGAEKPRHDRQRQREWDQSATEVRSPLPLCVKDEEEEDDDDDDDDDCEMSGTVKRL